MRVAFFGNDVRQEGQERLGIGRARSQLGSPERGANSRRPKFFAAAPSQTSNERERTRTSQGWPTRDDMVVAGPRWTAAFCTNI